MFYSYYYDIFCKYLRQAWLIILHSSVHQMKWQKLQVKKRQILFK